MDYQELINQDKLVLLDFHADWCGPCALLETQLDEVKAELKESIEIRKIDVEKDKVTTIHFDTTYHIMGIPTLLLFRNGKLLWKHKGVLNKDALLNQLSSYLNA